MSEYEVGEIPPEQLEKQKKRPYLSEEEKDILSLEYIQEYRLAKLIVEYLSSKDKETAEKVAKLIIRDYGEVLKALEEEEE